MSRIKVKHVVLYQSEAFNGEVVKKTISDGDRVVKSRVFARDMGFAKTKMRIVFDDGEVVETSSNYNESVGEFGESVSNTISMYHRLVKTNKMPKWYAIYGENAAEKWSDFRNEYLDFIEKYDYGLGF